jgi:lipopolysaccharide/colanic/teichoic acid biosynthesis glycosyltransferase
MEMKRVFDFVVALSALLLLALPLLALAWLIHRKLGSPVLFRQVRPGMQAKPFTMVKFRTMTDECGPDGALLPDAQRLTPFGRFLRSTSLDELPELWNVLKGDMSIVGPRPLLTQYLPYYTEFEKERFLIRPGITGWAQINGRNLAKWNERLFLDVWYVRNRSMILDVKIIIKTFLKVLKRDGVVIDPSALMLNLDEERNKN